MPFCLGMLHVLGCLSILGHPVHVHLFSMHMHLQYCITLCCKICGDSFDVIPARELPSISRRISSNEPSTRVTFHYRISMLPKKEN